MTQRKPRTVSEDGGNTRSYRFNTASWDKNQKDVFVEAPKIQSRPQAKKRPAPANGAPAGRRPSSGTGSRSASQTEHRANVYNKRDVGTPVRMASAPAGKRRRKKKSHGGLVAVIVILLLVIAGAVVLLTTGILKKDKDPQVAEQTSLHPYGPPSPAIESTASIGATGDILIHNSVLYGADYGDHYDFSESFAAMAPYWSDLDYMVANLEVTCGGEESGAFTGYPAFNSPDEVVTGLKNAGVDMLLTANNHSYDTGGYGFMRTQQVADEAGLDHLGTRESTDDSYVIVKDVNGIRFGMTCYTYDTRETTGYMKSLNGNVMSDETADLVNSFTYEDLDWLYGSAEDAIGEMKAADCDVIIFFMHWGTEYMDDPNEYQMEIAQKLSDLGVDIIIGGHPHVIQRFEELTGAGGNTTYCLYSMGNAISSQRKEIMTEDGSRGYTEDGLTIEVSYMKFNNGKVKLQGVYVLPTWVDYRDDGVFEIVPLDSDRDPSNWDTYYTYDAVESYNRTLGRLGEDYPAVRELLGQDEVPDYLEY